MASAQLRAEPFSPEALLAGFLEGRANDGAVVSFVGLARAAGRDGGPVTALTLDWHPVLTERSMAQIAEDGETRFGVSDLLVVHRCGDVAPGEAIVFVAAAAPHRRDAFLAADYVMDRLKTEAAFWKREHGPDGDCWIEPTDNDRADLARWST